MKKFLFALLVCSLLLASCTKYEEPQSSQEESKELSSEAASEEVSEAEEFRLFDFAALSEKELAEYITIGEYKGLESEKVVVEITDKNIDDAIKTILEQNAEWQEVTYRPIQEGDNVTMDYVGYLDGVAFEGGTANDAEIVIGEGKYIDGFEDGLIGVKSGENVSLNLTFPKEYHNSDLAGKAVVFEVKVKLVEELILPKLTEEIIKETTDDKASTEEDFRKYLKNALYEDAARKALNVSKNKYWAKAVENATVNKYPDGIVEEYAQFYVDYYSQYAAMYGVSLEDFVGCTEEEFKDEYRKQAEAMYKDQMVYHAAMFAEEYEMTIVDSEYTAWLENLAALKGTSVEAIADQYDVETLQNSYLYEAFITYLYNTRVEVEPSTSEDTSTDTSSETVSEESTEEK